MPKIIKKWTFNEKVYRIRKTSQKRFRLIARYYDAEEVIHKRISSNWEDISNSGPKAMQKLWKIELLMKMGIRSAKPHRAVFRFFARYYDAEEVIHKCISWDWEDISNSGSKAMPKIMKNWTFNEKVYRIRKTSQERFPLFARYYDAEEVIHQCISWNREDISNSGPKAMPKIIKKWTFNEKVYRIRKPHRSVFAFLQDITMLKKWFISAFPEIWEDISNSGPKAMPKIIQNWTFNEKVHRIRKTSQSRFSLFCKILRCIRSDS